MLQTFIITLREGVEAALVIAIAIAYLRKTGRQELLPSVYRAFSAAVIASFVFAWIFTRFQVTEESYEGWTLLASAVFVFSMVIWMNRHAKGLEGRNRNPFAKGGRLGKIPMGCFAFVFLMIFREGVETVLLLGAVRLDTSGIMDAIGVVLGVGLAILFGVSFVRGTIRINLRNFFRMTTAILMVVVFQLVLTGLHELSEGRSYRTAGRRWRSSVLLFGTKCSFSSRSSPWRQPCCCLSGAGGEPR